MKRINVNRRDFIKSTAFITGSTAGAGLLVGANPELEAAALPTSTANRKSFQAACPYCGVGCGTLIQT